MSSFVDVNVYRTRRQVNLEVICRYLLSQFGSVFYVPILRNGRQACVLRAPLLPKYSGFERVLKNIHARSLKSEAYRRLCYSDSSGVQSGPGRIELGDCNDPTVRRTIFGDEPRSGSD